MLVGAVCGISDKYYSFYSCSLCQWSHQHTHSKSELLVIGRLSTFQAPEVDVYEDLHPMRILLAVLEAEQVSPLIKGGGKQTISLRAPPALAA